MKKCAASSRPSLHPGNIVAVVLKWLRRPFDFMIRFVLLMRFPFKRLLVVGAVIFLGCGLIPRVTRRKSVTTLIKTTFSRPACPGFFSTCLLLSARSFS
jgi:hypothetical protein